MKNRIKELRLSKGLTQEKLAELLGTSKGMVSMLEVGDRRLNTDWVEKLTIIFDCNPSEIWGAPTDEDVWEQRQLKRLQQLDDEKRKAFEHMLDAMTKGS